MTSKKKLECIYVTLDAILDTRLATIAKIDQKLATSVLESGKYHCRDEDVFDGVTKEVFKEQYSKRDVDTLAMSVVTETIKLVRHLVGVLAEQAIQRPYHDGSKIVLNYYPYDLNIEERDNIGRAVAAWMQGIAPVELVSISPKELTPDHCKNNYAMMITYEYEEWMNIHAEAFKQTRLPQVVMFVPAIYFDQKPTEDELRKLTKDSMPPMQAIELLASPIIELRLIDIKYFSIINPNEEIPGI